MPEGWKKQTFRKAQQAPRGDHPGSESQVDAHAFVVTYDWKKQGVIRPDELYTIEELKQRLGITNSTLRAARRAGLRVRYKHRLAFVHGSDWIDYVLLSQGDKIE
jgi:hypothetical protein